MSNIKGLIKHSFQFIPLKAFKYQITNLQVIAMFCYLLSSSKPSSQINMQRRLSCNELE